MFNFSSLNAVFVRLRKSDSNMFLHIFTISWFVSLHKVQVLNHWYQGQTLWVFASRKIETTPFNHFQPMAPEPFCGSWNVPLHLQFYSQTQTKNDPRRGRLRCHHVTKRAPTWSMTSWSDTTSTPEPKMYRSTRYMIYVLKPKVSAAEYTL